MNEKEIEKIIEQQNLKGFEERSECDWKIYKRTTH